MNYEKVPNAEADAVALKNWVDRYCAIVNAGDFDAYRTLWTDDVIYMPPNGPACQGIEDCVDVNRFYFEQYQSVEKHYVQEVEIADRFAYVRVNYTYHGVPKGDGEPREEDGKAIFMLKRSPDGTWLASHLVWNSNIPLEQ